MRKISLFLILFFIALPAVFSQSDFVINWNLANIGFGGNFPLNDRYSSEGNFTGLSFGLEHRHTGLGFEFSPFTIFFWNENGEFETDVYEAEYSYFNLKLFWNIFREYIFFGPFTSVNYFFIEDKIAWNKSVFTLGVQAGFRLCFTNVNYNLLIAESGYRIINGRGKYFFGIKVDVVSLFLLYLYAKVSSYDSDY